MTDVSTAATTISNYTTTASRSSRSSSMTIKQ